ncbi:hypothetical protein GDO86_019024, partial [Hymenochirus boettgeri]
MSLLEDTLSKQKNPDVKNIIQEQFCGQYAYVTILPSTLNLQLMRFVFDRQTGHKKKLNTYIGFSETLDMNPYLEQTDNKYLYELSAVLIHRGVSAYSGHYIAHVKDPQTGEWYKFNDEEIEKMEGKKLQLGIEEDLGKAFYV